MSSSEENTDRVTIEGRDGAFGAYISRPKTLPAPGKVAVRGYCLGGLITSLTAARYGADAAVVYNGGDTEKYLGEVNGLNAPLVMHLAEGDEFISKTAQAEIKTALASKPNA